MTDILARLAEGVTALTQQALAEHAILTERIASLERQLQESFAENLKIRDEGATAIKAVIATLGRNPETSRAIEEAFEEGRRAGLAEAATMAETYAFTQTSAESIRLAQEPGMVVVTQAWLAEHIRARAEGRDEPQREPWVNIPKVVRR